MQNHIRALISMYNEGRLAAVVQKAQGLIAEHPRDFMLWNIYAAASQGMGRLSDAERGFRKASELNPKFPDAQNNLGVVLHSLRKFDEALAAYERALKIKPDYAQARNNYANTLKLKGDLKKAITQYKRAIALRPNYTEAYFNLGNALKESNAIEDAARAFSKALSFNPNYLEALNNLGFAQLELGQFEQAVATNKKILSIKPHNSHAQNNVGLALQKQGHFDEALSAFDRAIEMDPDHAEAHSNRGDVLAQMGDHEAAIKAYERALSVRSNAAEVHFNLANELKKVGRTDEAITAYTKAIDVRPDYVGAYANMSGALYEQGRMGEAISAGKIALNIDATFTEAYNNVGNAYTALGDYESAIASLNRAIELSPDEAELHNNLASALHHVGRLEDAIISYEKALSLKPDFATAESQALFQKRRACQWIEETQTQEACDRLGLTTNAVPPFAMLSLEDNARRQLQRSRNWAQERYRRRALPLPAKPKKRPERLRIAYLSSDFHDHATMYLMAGLFREHDREKFEVFAFSYGREKSGSWRQQAENSVDYFMDVSGKSDQDIAELVRSKNIDVAIDLKGYTESTRSGLFQYRLAPVQVNFLGYPGSMGADFIDYIIADQVLIPEEQRQHYSENVIFLPDTYQPNDNLRPIAHTDTSRTDFALPEHAFVFCCFNNSYKIGLREFEIWMMILAQLDDSVLWLLRSNSLAERNLRREAEARGVAPSRLVFADPLPHAEHLARHKHADLFIDTFNYNAHTTASDALWAGLPVVTKLGAQFSARVAGSLLSAVGLPELVAATDEDYKALIVDMATDEMRLETVKAKLKGNLSTCRLFDSASFARHFEDGLGKAYDAYFSGVKPHDIRVGNNAV